MCEGLDEATLQTFPTRMSEGNMTQIALPIRISYHEDRIEDGSNGGPERRLLKVVHLSTHDIAGGAARAAHRLHSSLRQYGVDTSMLVREARTNDPSVIRFQPTTSLLGRLKRRFRREQIQRKLRSSIRESGDRLEPFRIDRSEYGADLVSHLPPHDIVNLHWVADFVDYPSFLGKLSTGQRLVWTLHDMNAFTGGCHYDLGCGRYLQACGECPQLGMPAPSDLSSQIWARKKALFENLPSDQVHFVAPSSWLADQAKQSPLLRRFPISVLPYGLDLNDFAPREKFSAREVFGIPHQAKVVLFVADGLPLMRKGFGKLIEALEHIKSRLPHLCLVMVGHNSPDLKDRVPHMNLGPITNDRLLSNVYSAADVLAIPSLQDNLPNTVLESMACGTPVVGFAVGGIPDMVRNKKTGLLVPPHDVALFGSALVEIVSDSHRLTKMGENCRRAAEQGFSLLQQASRYEELYGRLIRQRVSPSVPTSVTAIKR